MNTSASVTGRKYTGGGSMVMLLLVLTTTSVAFAALLSLVSQQSRLTRRRADLVSSLQYAQAGAAIALANLNAAVNNASNNLFYNLGHGTYPYSTDSSSSQQIVFKRIISSPFANNQQVTAQIIITNPATPNSAIVTATATVGSVTQSVKAHCKMAWGYPAAIISVNPGDTDTSVAKTAGQDGNVVINGSTKGPIVVDGNVADAVLSNGRVNYDTNYINPPKTAYSSTNYNTANEIPDYTTQGTSNTLFDINRFIAVADKTPGGPSASGNNHFTNFANFYKAITNSSFTNPIEGVVVVDVTQADANKYFPLTASDAPKGINIKGTMIFNFIGSGWDPTTEKIIISADLNVNAANLSGLVATNPATYPSGYPPVYSNSAKNPVNIDITSKGFANFTPGDDLPAIIYTIGVLDIHGNCDISGVMYTPSYMEIENKANSQTQYIKGALIMGHGIYYENQNAATSIISFDSKALDSLTTMGGVGKQVSVTYWE